jgi:hypothetical protein
MHSLNEAFLPKLQLCKCEFIPETDLEQAQAQTQTWAPLHFPVV